MRSKKKSNYQKASVSLCFRSRWRFGSRIVVQRSGSTWRRGTRWSRRRSWMPRPASTTRPPRQGSRACLECLAWACCTMDILTSKTWHPWHQAAMSYTADTISSNMTSDSNGIQLTLTVFKAWCQNRLTCLVNDCTIHWHDIKNQQELAFHQNIFAKVD